MRQRIDVKYKLKVLINKHFITIVINFNETSIIFDYIYV